ncbi:MAG: dihydrolipoamide acetyltransferase family protein [Alphaproteobacteria bacterium]
MSEFRMPALGADMDAGTLVEWRIKPGDVVKRGAIAAVVETQKGAIEVEIFEEGTVTDLVVPVGTRVPVGTVLARLGGEGRAAIGVAPASAPPPKPAAVAPMAAPVVTPARTGMPSTVAGRARVTPVARRRAAEAGLDLAALSGTGVDGAITLADVEAALMAPAPAPGPRRAMNAGDMRRAIAAATSRSKREIPHYYLTQTVDLGPAMAWLAAFNQDRPPPERLMPAVLLLKATALALRDVPALNGTFEDGAFRPGSGIHVGWAVALRGGGLMAPTLRDVDRRTLADLMRSLRDLVQRARSGGLKSSELAIGTITITSLGDRGADTVTGVIYPPQVAIVGFGRIATRPWIVDGAVAARPLVTVSLSGDHRATDGHVGGLFLAAVERHLAEPHSL